MKKDLHPQEVLLLQTKKNDRCHQKKLNPLVEKYIRINSKPK